MVSADLTKVIFNVEVTPHENSEEIIAWYREQIFFEDEDEDEDILYDAFGLKITNLEIYHIGDNTYEFEVTLNKDILQEEESEEIVHYVIDTLIDPDDDGNHPLDNKLIRGRFIEDSLSIVNDI